MHERDRSGRGASVRSRKCSLLDLKIKCRLPELASIHVFYGQTQLVLARRNLLRHVDLVNDEVVSAMVLANVGFHRQDLFGDSFSCRIDNLVASLKLRLKAIPDLFGRDVFNLAVEQNFLIGTELILRKLGDHTIPFDFGAKSG